MRRRRYIDVAEDDGDGEAPPLAVQARFGSTQEFFGSDVVFGKKSEAKRLLTIDSTEIYGNETLGPAGAWVIALSTEIIKPGNPLLPAQIIPLKARLTASAGGAQHFFEVDCFPSSIVPVFAPSVTVDVFWEPPEEGDAWTFPEEVLVRGTAHQATLRGDATESIYVNGGLGGSVLFIPVPPFVESWAIRADAAEVIFSAASSIRVMGGSNSVSQALFTIPGDVLLTTLQAGQMIPMPGTAVALRITPGGAPFSRFIVEYRLRF